MIGDLLYLRALEPDDIKNTLKWRQDDDIWEMLISRRYYVSFEMEENWLKNSALNNQDNVKLAACLRENNEHVGNVYLTDIDWFNRSALFGIMIGNKNHQGKGLGQEMVQLMLKHGFYDLGLERIYSYQLTYNKASIKLHEKCGFKNEGLLRNAVLKQGENQDLNVMGILKRDFFNL